MPFYREISTSFSWVADPYNACLSLNKQFLYEQLLSVLLCVLASLSASGQVAFKLKFKLVDQELSINKIFIRDS